MNTKWIAKICFLSMVLSLTGCATTGFLKFSKNDFPKASKQNPVIRILGLWQPAEGMWENKTVRGFSGQILFFSQNSDAPAQVDGSVRIYVFDDKGSPDDQAKPFHEFNFPLETWNALLGKGSLGATYNVFIPYTRPGFDEASCSLRIRYTPSGTGFPTYSEMVDIQLPGRKKPKAASASSADSEGASQSHPASGSISERKAPFARGVSQAIPAEEIEKLKSRRPPAVELTDKERERILREARARLS